MFAHTASKALRAFRQCSFLRQSEEVSGTPLQAPAARLHRDQASAMSQLTDPATRDQASCMPHPASPSKPHS